MDVSETPEFYLHKFIHPAGEPIAWHKMRFGQMGIVEDKTSPVYNGELVYRGYGVLLSLTIPGRSWSTGSLKVKLLSPSDAVTLIVR